MIGLESACAALWPEIVRRPGGGQGEGCTPLQWMARATGFGTAEALDGMQGRLLVFYCIARTVTTALSRCVMNVRSMRHFCCI
jgi:hypothetical protein